MMGRGVVLSLVEGGGGITRMMGDFGKGLKAFKKQMKEGGGSGESDEDVKTIDTSESAKADTVSPEKDKAANG